MSVKFKVVKPSAILDSTKASALRKEINKLIEENANIILVDLQDVTFMDSSGLGALVLCLNTVRAAGGKFFLSSINEQIKVLFELTSMEEFFEIFPNQQECEKAFLNK
jgi:anti-anti-sigma factor